VRKRIVTALAILAMFLFVTATCNSASGTTYAVGVKAGDTADYTISITGEPNSTAAHVYFCSVVGTTVTLNASLILKNGSHSKPEQYTCDVAADHDLMWYLIPSNLTTNDPIHPGCEMKINKTEPMTVAGASRTVVYLNYTSLHSPFPYYYPTGGIWWDRQTGIGVKATIRNVNPLTLAVSWFNYTLTSTSLWSPDFSTTTILLVGAVALIVIIATVVLLRKRHRKGHG